MVKIGYFLLLAVLLAACTPAIDTATGGVEQPLSGNIRQVSLDVEGMTCASCAYGVESQFKEVDGVISADASWTKGSCVVKYDADKTDPETIAKASTVYPATVIEVN